jgi:glycosyltransferase involved in cell wall biosynthesis
VSQPNPVDAQTLGRFHLFAVLGTWMEADVVAATVSNARAQGCERVLLVDNDSPDATISEALGAGAELADHFSTAIYDEVERLRRMNDVVARVSELALLHSPADHVWWLYLDADEFHHGPAGLTLKQYLSGLDQRFRVVGARCFEHYPGARSYVPGRHPLDSQPLCEEAAAPMCSDGHRKHPLLRWDRHGPRIQCERGFHSAHVLPPGAALPLLEPELPVFLHHFPFREKEVTRRRLFALCSRGPGEVPRIREGDDAAMSMRQRFASLEDVYAGRRTPALQPEGTLRPGETRPWSSVVAAHDADVARWYDESAAATERCLVSIVIPNRDYARYLRACIESALAQTHAACEIVVVDDGSSDESRIIIAEYAGLVVALHQEHAGLARARNTGAAAATGDYLLFLDSDDQLLPLAVEELLQRLRTTSCGLVIGDCIITDAEGRDLGPVSTDGDVVTVQALVGGNPFNVPAALFSRSAFRSAGGFNPALEKCEDYDMWLKSLAVTKVAHLAKPVARIRRHAGSMSHDLIEQSRWELRVALSHRHQFPAAMGQAVELLHVRLAHLCRRASDRPGFWHHAWRAVASAPHHWRNWARVCYRAVVGLTR